LPGYDYCLLHGEPPTENRMRNDIRENQPCRPRRQREAVLGTVRLIGAIPFEPIMKMQHEGVVWRSIHNRQPDPFHSPCDAPFQAIQRRGRGFRVDCQPCLLRFAPRQFRKGIRRDPLPRLVRIYVGKTTQNQIAKDRARGEGVDVQQVVALRKRQFPAPFFDRTETRIVYFPGLRILRKNPREKCQCGLRIFAHRAADLLSLRAIDQTGYAIEARLIRDVLVKAARILRGTHQLSAHRGGNLKPATRKEKNVATLQYGAVIGCVAGVLKPQALSVTRWRSMQLCLRRGECWLRSLHRCCFEFAVL